MIPYSLLDLAPVPEGSTTRDALANMKTLAQAAEGWGYNRYWLAEHHNMPGIASAATAVLIGHVASVTKRMKVGSGGIMLPNHAPLMVAEAFGTLAELFPDRIEVGLGRAPGTDMATARALRRGLDHPDSFPQDVVELMGFLSDAPSPVSAYPGKGTHVPIWMLGSSLFGAQLAAQLGLPYAFASHFAPAALSDAIETYRRQFRPSAQLEKPYFMLASNVFAADTEEEAMFIRTSMQQAFAKLRLGQPGKLPHPVERIEDHIPTQFLPALDQALSVSACGTPEMVRTQLAGFIEKYQPDEIILTGNIHDPKARMRSFEIAAEAMKSL